MMLRMISERFLINNMFINKNIINNMSINKRFINNMFINNLKNKFPDMQNIFIMMLKVISERFFHPQFINNTFIKNIFSIHESRVISVEETTQRHKKKKGLDSKCTNCGNKLVTICHLIAHVRQIHKEKKTLVCSRL